MAQANNGDETMISGINVTPLVDVVLVLLVVLMVTATYIASRTIPVDLPKGATGEATNVVLAITVDSNGEFFLDGARAQDGELRARVREARGRDPEVRAVIAADASSRHGSVVKVIDLLRQERVNRFAINVEPQDLAKR
ncbi:MAG TPA: biopolymer transporter ExbD [Polyangiaceae bacterium]|nr:biopolymer transporter ExbD [Polyangiaceae bacterium]